LSSRLQPTAAGGTHSQPGETLKGERLVGLKPPRKKEYEEVVTAHLKVCPFKNGFIGLLPSEYTVPA
jgi:hypothetical protein